MKMFFLRDVKILLSTNVIFAKKKAWTLIKKDLWSVAPGMAISKRLRYFF